MRNWMAYVPHPYVSGVFIAMFVYLLVQSPPVMVDTDVPWHLASGDYIRDHGIPQTDPFSFSAGDISWINLSWAWDVLISVVAQWGGLESLRVLSATVIALTLAMLMHHLVMRKNLSASEACLMVAVVALVMWPTAINVRPYLVSFLFTAWLHYWLFRCTSQQRIRALYAIVPLTILWANTHGGFLAVYVFVGLYMVQCHREQKIALRNHLIIVGALCVLAALVTPWHIHIVEGVLRTLNSVITMYIEEWQPLQIGISVGFSLALFLYILLSDHMDQQVPLADRVIPVVWLVAAFESVRNFYYFAITAAPFIAYRFHVYNATQKNQGPLIAEQSIPRAVYAAATTAALLVLVLGWVSPLQQWIARKALVEDKPLYSMELFNELAQQYPDARFLNDYDMGGYMLYGSSLRPFVDGRAGTAYPESLLGDFIEFQKLSSNWMKILDKYEIDGLILSNASPYVILYNMGGAHDVLKRIHEDKHISVFLYKPDGDEKAVASRVSSE